MNVLIVGGTGEISSAVVDKAVMKGIEGTCVNRGYNSDMVPDSFLVLTFV